VEKQIAREAAISLASERLDSVERGVAAPLKMFVEIFLKNILPGRTTLLVSASRKKRDLHKRRTRCGSRRKKIENNSKFPLTAKSKSLQCSSRKTSGGARKSIQFFQLQGLQIELNLVPTMK
jgi:hypothetical protein